MTTAKSSQQGSGENIFDKAFCPYCGCGCRLQVKLSDGSNEVSATSGSRIEKFLPDVSDPVSQGKPCVKGLVASEILTEGRVRTPMIRNSKREVFKECTWDEAFEFIKKKLDQIFPGTNYCSTNSTVRNMVYFVGSGETTNEANFLLSKLARSYFGSNNIDSCARLCHAATGAAFNQIFGMKAIPNYSIDDLLRADCFFFVGTDPLEDYPVLFNRVLEAKKKGAKIITVDLAPSGTSAQSELFLKITPGGILPMLCHLIVRLVDKGDISRDARMFDGFQLFVDSARAVSQANPVSSFGFTRDQMEQLYWMINDSKSLSIGFGMGLTQHLNGVENVKAIAGLAAIMNAILFPNRGKINVQGAGDVGADPDWGGGSDFGKNIELLGWNSNFLNHHGTVMTEALYDEEVKFCWIMPSNPALSMPDINALEKSFARKFIILHAHHENRTMEFADVVLPSLLLTESPGSITTGERRVRGLWNVLGRKNTIGGGSQSEVLTTRNPLTDAEVIVLFANYLGAKGFGYSDLKQVFEEIVKVVPGYHKLEYKMVECDEGMFAEKKPAFIKLPTLKYDRLHFSGSGEYPFILTTARNRFQFCTGDCSRNSKTLNNLSGGPVVYINPRDAELMEVADGLEIKIISEVGEVAASAKIDAGVEKRVLVAPFHFEKLLINKLTPRQLDPVSKTPCYKEVHVRVQKV